MCSADASRAALAHLGRFVLQHQEPGAPDWEGEPRTVQVVSQEQMVGRHEVELDAIA